MYREIIIINTKNTYTNINTNINTDANENANNSIMTLFQRYSNEPFLFFSCSDTFIMKGDIQTHNFNTSKPIPSQFEHFFHLINNKEVNITYNINNQYKLDDDYWDREKTNCYKLFYTTNN